MPIEAFSMARWRNWIDEKGFKWTLTETIAERKQLRTLQARDLMRFTVDTTVIEKTIAHPAEPPRVYRQML